MLKFTQTFSIILGVFITLSLTAQENDKAAAAPEILPKLIKLSLKKICKTRKLRSKEEFPQTEGGIDYQHDDKKDSVSVTVNVENKNKASLINYKIVAVVYGKSVTEKRASPEVYTDFVEEIKELKSRDKYKKEFTCEMTYDKSDDTLEKEPEVEGGDTKRMTTKAFGTSFYGYKVDIVNEEGKVVLTSVWPGGLEKVLKKAKEKIEIKEK